MQKKDIDTTLSLLIIFMLLFGMVMISSVSVHASYSLTSRLVASGRLDEVSNSYFLVRTMMYVFIGIVVMTIFSKIPYFLFEKYAKYIFWFGIFGLFLVFIPWVGTEINGAKGWIDIPGLPSIQPVEFAKMGLIVMLAYFMKKRRSLMSHLHYGFIPFFFIAACVMLPLMLQPDFGSILILAPVVLAMYFIGWGNIRLIGIGFLIAIVGALSVYVVGKTDVGSTFKIGYISERVDNFMRSNTEITMNRDTSRQNDYQLKQGFIALWSGGFFGLWFGNSIQKFGYLPESYGDFIFSVIVEELGFLGWTILIWLYLFFGYRGYMIARSVPDLFGKYLAFGITTWILVQAFVNIGVNLNVIPLTGVTLPFISYGGSSIISLTLATGILLSISRSMEYKPQNLSQALQAGRKVNL